MKHQNLLFFDLFHFLLGRLEHSEFTFLKFQFFLIQLLKFFLALVMSDLHIFHLLSVVVLLFSLRKLKIAIFFVELTKRFSHFLLHLGTTLLKLVLARAQVALHFV